jgi:hypothetical protein
VWMDKAFVRPDPSNSLCTPRSGFGYTSRFLNFANQLQVFAVIVTEMAKPGLAEAPEITHFC